jgi:hypothetical protein
MLFRHLKKRLGTFDKAIISDIALWLALALVLAGTAWWLAVELPARRGQRITLHFQDASAIIVGSPVRMMGLEIGHVADLKVRRDHVDVTLQTNPDAPLIPPGTSFTILFTGLGGSESIEASLPDSLLPPSLPIGVSAPYRVEEPIRLHQVLQSSVDTTRALQQGAENIADFFGKKKTVEELQFNIWQVHDWSDESFYFIAGVETGLGAAQEAIRRNARDRFATADALNRQLCRAVRVTGRPRPFSAALKRISESVRLCCPAPPRPWGKSVSATGKTGAIPAKTVLGRQHIRQATPSPHSTTLPDLLQGAESRLQQASEHLGKTGNWLDAHPPEPALERTQAAIQAFNRQVLIWNKRLEAKSQAASQSPMRSISP